MSVFSKIFIVINLALTLMLTGVMGTLLAQKADYLQNYSEEHRKYRDTAQVLKADKKAGAEAIATLSKNVKETADAAAKEDETFNRLSEERKTKSGQLAGRRKTKNELYTRINERKKSNNDLNDTVKTLVNQRNEANATKDREVAARDRALNRLEEVQDDVASAKQATANIKAMHQDFLAQKRELEGLIQQAKRLGVNVEKIAQETAQLGKVQGVIASVKADVYLVMLDIGKNDGVEEGMVLTVSRGDKYIGRVKVRNVFPGTSSAIIMLKYLLEGRSMKAGDKVIND